MPTSAVLFALLLSLLASVSSICPNAWTQYDEWCFKLYQGETSWLDASSFCLEFGSHLANLNTTAKINNVKLFLKEVNHKHSVWVGANDFRFESVWVWDADLKTFNVTDWSPGEPNSGTKQNCLLLPYSLGYRWADAPCGNKYDYLCERRLDVGDIMSTERLGARFKKPP